MPAESFRIVFAESAFADLEEMRQYWDARGESWRGNKYFRDLIDKAQTELRDPADARRGRSSKVRSHPAAREILAFGVYRIIYRIDETAGIVNVLRFWHAHRDSPDARS